MGTKHFGPRRHAWRIGSIVGGLALLMGAAIGTAVGGPPAASGYRQQNLVSDVPGLARFTDPLLVNAWGISFPPTGPFWISANETGVSVVYDRNGRPFPFRNPLVVKIPPSAGSDESTGHPTGQVFNGTTGFVVSAGGLSGPARFLFASEDGTITGWSPIVNRSMAITAVDNSGSEAIYKGLAMASVNGAAYLYAADFHNAKVDIFDSAFNAVTSFGSNTPFADPDLPAGYAPFNIRNLGGMLYITYALQDEDAEDDVPGPGHGFVDVYMPDGTFVKRLISMGKLNSPWGLEMAPSGFGRFSGALLVGNFGNGKINAYDPATGAWLGTLSDVHGNPLVIDGLWAITFGSGAQNGIAGKSDTLYFTAGPDHESHGLFGQITSIPGH